MRSEYIGNGHSVAVLESGLLEPHAPAQLLNLGLTRGAFARNHPFYLSTSRLRLFGGSQLAWGGWCTPLTHIDFERRDWVPDSGWPITLEELIPYYRRTARIFGLHESAAVPVEERPVLGGELTERNYYFAPGRRTARDIFQEKLANAENVFICVGANASNMHCNQGKTRAQRIEACSIDGAQISVRAKTFILAAGGIENARLLLSNDLGNRHGLAGRFFMEHPHVLLGSVHLPGKASWFRYSKRLDPQLGHGAMLALGVRAEAQRACKLLNATVQLWPVEESADQDDVLHARLVLRTEQSPNRNSRLTLGSDVDPLGMPVAQLDWEVDPQDWASVCATARLVASALARHVGARAEILVSNDSPWPDFPANADCYNPWGCHHIGTTRMSEDPRHGVVDTDTRVHGMDNLFIAGSSVFPTAGYANPTFTLTALALRTADYVRQLM